jgi:hypothetical protein
MGVKKVLKPIFLPPKTRFFSPEGLRKMDINRVDLLLKYILAAAGQEDILVVMEKGRDDYET